MKLFVFSRESDFLHVIYFIHYVDVTITVFRPIQTEGSYLPCRSLSVWSAEGPVIDDCVGPLYLCQSMSSFWTCVYPHRSLDSKSQSAAGGLVS